MQGKPVPMFRLRASRAAPPGRASMPERADTFDAAMAQFEELLKAANVAGPAASPLPLFYALSQAGRAISAAAASDGASWRLAGHGLQARALDGELLDVRVKPKESRNVQARTISSFQGVSELFGGEPIQRSVTIGDVWAALPEINDLLGRDGKRRRPLWVVPDDPASSSSKLFPWGRVFVTVVGLTVPDDVRGQARAQAVADELGNYAVGVEARWAPWVPVGMSDPVVSETSHGYGFRLSLEATQPTFAGHIAALRQVSREAHGFESFALLPALGDARGSRLSLWWLVLFGLSMVARYEPAGWARALDPRTSVIAAPVEELLRRALEVLPEIIWQQLEWARIEAIGNDLPD
ncbi:MAG: hypothetical protein J7513_07075 [Solirubrobacteraceae bacterium]|nr:hypothetical protein [Solirubrobacteraceae bacterium]